MELGAAGGGRGGVMKEKRQREEKEDLFIKYILNIDVN